MKRSLEEEQEENEEEEEGDEEHMKPKKKYKTNQPPKHKNKIAISISQRKNHQRIQFNRCYNVLQFFMQTFDAYLFGGCDAFMYLYKMFELASITIFGVQNWYFQEKQRRYKKWNTNSFPASDVFTVLELQEDAERSKWLEQFEFYPDLWQRMKRPILIKDQIALSTYNLGLRNKDNDWKIHVFPMFNSSTQRGYGLSIIFGADFQSHKDIHDEEDPDRCMAFALWSFSNCLILSEAKSILGSQELNSEDTGPKKKRSEFEDLLPLQRYMLSIADGWTNSDHVYGFYEESDGLNKVFHPNTFDKLNDSLCQLSVVLFNHAYSKYIQHFSLQDAEIINRVHKKINGRDPKTGIGNTLATMTCLTIFNYFIATDSIRFAKYTGDLRMPHFSDSPTVPLSVHATLIKDLGTQKGLLQCNVDLPDKGIWISLMWYTLVIYSLRWKAVMCTRAFSIIPPDLSIGKSNEKINIFRQALQTLAADLSTNSQTFIIWRVDTAESQEGYKEGFQIEIHLKKNIAMLINGIRLTRVVEDPQGQTKKTIVEADELLDMK